MNPRDNGDDFPINHPRKHRLALLEQICHLVEAALQSSQWASWSRFTSRMWRCELSMNWKGRDGALRRPRPKGGLHGRSGKGSHARVADDASQYSSQCSQRAFTLIELVISTALIAIVLTGAYACLNAGLSSQKVVEPRTDILQSARVVLGLLSADLRCACPLPRGAPFLGMPQLIGNVSADNLDFATHNYIPRRPGEGDFCETSIFLERDPRTGQFTLFRRRNPTLAFDPLSGGLREELATGLAGLQLEYYDGWDWYNSWGDPQAGSTKSELSTPKPNEIGLPEAVRITLLFEVNPRPIPPADPDLELDREPPLAFQTVVRINLPNAGSSSGSSGTGSGSTEATPSSL